MTPFIEVSHIGQGFIFTVLFLIFTAGLICVAVSAHYKVGRAKISLCTLAFSAEGIMIWLLLSGYMYVFKRKPLGAAGEAFNSIPLFALILYIVFVFSFTVIYVLRLTAFIKGHITSMSVKESMDKLPTGLCFYAENGQTLLVNHSMSDVCIGSGAFYGTAWYNNQPDGLIYAGKVAYKYKGTMPANTSITLKSDTKEISGSAFDYCTGLTSVTIGNSVTRIGDRAFNGCTGLTSITIPGSVTSIGTEAFSGCTGLTSITIPGSVTSIGRYAFIGCAGLTSVTFADASTWYITKDSTNWENKTGGTQTSVTEASTNATYFKSTYYNYYWYKK